MSSLNTSRKECRNLVNQQPEQQEHRPANVNPLAVKGSFDSGGPKLGGLRSG